MFKVLHTESGYDFITLYFKDQKEVLDAGTYVERKFKRIGFPYYHLQRKDMRHIPGDVPHFHSDGEPDKMYEHFKHFHILYDHEPTEDDWEYLYKYLNDGKIELKRGLSHRQVIRSE